ncbi:putative bifunctional diguanylate cyclase/phosphodiesterase [Halomonas salinarum]|uniref:putative bifunctional diguanylate cyclase/phosphodiesterase n=1 Tax=Halomonas salinarum TaxID=1158993 RepID=UPI001FD72BD4|nr:bifunctional diguanylate cyclase/phosphodiesterase [Halomonas salinarum]
MPYIANRHTFRCGVIVLLLGLGVWIVYATGGTAYAYAYLMLIPVLLAAAWYALPGGLLTALVVSISMTIIPLDVGQGIEQHYANYLLRIAFYLVIGGTAGWLFQSRRRAFLAQHDAARTDQPSGLANQVALGEDLHVMLSSPVSPVATTGLIKVKITDITDVIEALGLEAADELVIAMSQRLCEAIRGGGQVYRTGPDELALVVMDVAPSDLDTISQRLLEVGEESFLISQVPVRVQLALGCTISEDHKIPSELLREARTALLASIRLRRGYTHFSPTFDQRSLESFKLIAQVREGLAAREFELHYQPKICLADGLVCGCEGLIRWRGNGGRLIPPAHFMPKVESTSLIGPLTSFVAQTASAISLQAGTENKVAINVSVHNLADDAFHDLLSDLINQSCLRPDNLEVEITESGLMDNIETARVAIQRIRDLGIGVSIDDFGTGFSSFEYLQHLPITGLKIDRTFVISLEGDERARKLMACMIDIGHALNLVVTAEGVETPQQAEILRQLGCDQAQGFYYSPALPVTEYHDWCRDYLGSLTRER